jgi:hypothetical protein
MKAPALFLLAASIVPISALIAADQTTPAYTPLRPVNQCLRPDRINQWYVVDSRTVVARTGPDHYLVKLQANCPRLGIGQGLRFNPSRANLSIGMGVLCGEAGETLSSRDQPPCGVQSVAKIDKAQYQQLETLSIESGNP